MVSCFFHKLRVLRGTHYDTLGSPPSTYVCLLVGLFARTATYPALKEHLQGSWEGGYRISASVIYVKTWLYIYEVDPATRLLWRTEEWQSQLIPHWEDVWDRDSILDPEEEDCGVHLAEYLLAAEVGSVGLRQPLATEWESWLHAVLLGSGWSDQFFGEAYFSRRSSRVISPPRPVGSPRITHLTISGFKGAVVVSVPDVRNHIIEKMS